MLSSTSILWGFIGLILGAASKFLFDHVLALRLVRRREIRQIVTQYSRPILRAAESLERRINNFVLTYDKKWFDNDDYYRLSTLYQFGCFLGWVRILEYKVVFLEFEKSKKSREFNIRLNTVFKAFTGFEYFDGIDDFEAKDASTIPRLVLTAIGELMIADSNQHNNISIIGFTTFVKHYENDDQYKQWFGYLKNFLSNLKLSSSDLRWDRLILIGAALRRLIWFLDPKSTCTRSRQLCNIDLIQNPCVKTCLLKETLTSNCPGEYKEELKRML